MEGGGGGGSELGGGEGRGGGGHCRGYQAGAGGDRRVRICSFHWGPPTPHLPAPPPASPRSTYPPSPPWSPAAKHNLRPMDHPRTSKSLGNSARAEGHDGDHVKPGWARVKTLVPRRLSITTSLIIIASGSQCCAYPYARVRWSGVAACIWWVGGLRSVTHSPHTYKKKSGKVLSRLPLM